MGSSGRGVAHTSARGPVCMLKAGRQAGRQPPVTPCRRHPPSLAGAVLQTRAFLAQPDFMQMLQDLNRNPGGRCICGRQCVVLQMQGSASAVAGRGTTTTRTRGTRDEGRLMWAACACPMLADAMQKYLGDERFQLALQVGVVAAAVSLLCARGLLSSMTLLDTACKGAAGRSASGCRCSCPVVQRSASMCGLASGGRVGAFWRCPESVPPASRAPWSHRSSRPCRSGWACPFARDPALPAKRRPAAARAPTAPTRRQQEAALRRPAAAPRPCSRTRSRRQRPSLSVPRRSGSKSTSERDGWAGLWAAFVCGTRYQIATRRLLCRGVGATKSTSGRVQDACLRACCSVDAHSVACLHASAAVPARRKLTVIFQCA